MKRATCPRCGDDDVVALYAIPIPVGSLVCRSCGLVAPPESFGIKATAQGWTLKLRRTLARLDNLHVYVAIDTTLVTGWVILMPSLVWAWILFVAIGIVAFADLFDVYVRKINKKGRLLVEAGII